MGDIGGGSIIVRRVGIAISSRVGTCLDGILGYGVGKALIEQKILREFFQFLLFQSLPLFGDTESQTRRFNGDVNGVQ